MKDIGEWMRDNGTAVDEAVSETHVKLDDVRQALVKNSDKLYQDMINMRLVSNRHFSDALIEVMYDMFKNLPGHEKIDAYQKHVGDTGYIDKLYAADYVKDVVKMALERMAMELVDKKPYKFGKPDKLAKIALDKYCKMCK